MAKQQRLIITTILVVLTTLISSTIAFTTTASTVHTTTTSTRIPYNHDDDFCTVATQPTSSRSMTSYYCHANLHRRRLHRPQQQVVVFFSKRDDEDETLREDWKALTHAASNFTKHASVKVVDAFHKVFSKSKDLISHGGQKIKTAFLRPKQRQQGEQQQQQQQQQVDDESHDVVLGVHDEDLFRNLLGDEDLFVVPSEPTATSVDTVVTRAISLLSKDKLVTKLLGPYLRYGKPFSQSRWTTTINGRSTSTVRASFEVWGSQLFTLGRQREEKGVASVAWTDNQGLTSLVLQVHGRRYILDTGTENQPQQQQRRGEAYKDNRDFINVEILDDMDDVDGFHRPPRGLANNNVLDAEILDDGLLP